ncbi:MAG: lyase repeat-like domain protein [Myxococcaceae bacterium]|nr:lyase repeat-like domain protein [Myxococcaceae bacterium]
MTRIRFRVVRWIATLSVVVGTVVGAGSDTASAQTATRTEFLVDRLKYPPISGVSDDFRVRTNAALALGASDDDNAITPLCQALNDPSEVVRQAVAVALKRLARPSSGSCMKSRLDRETNASVKLQLQRAIEATGSGSGGGTTGGTSANGVDNFVPPLVPKAKYYVAISKVTNNTKRVQADVDKVVLASIRTKLGTMNDYQLAPMTETPDGARAVMSKRGIKKGFYLSIATESAYTSEGLRVKVKCVVFSYPGKAMIAEMPTSLVNPSVRAADPSAEDNLMDMAAAHSVELFAQNITAL